MSTSIFLATLSLTQVCILSNSSCLGISYRVITISKATMLEPCASWKPSPVYPKPTNPRQSSLGFVVMKSNGHVVATHCTCMEVNFPCHIGHYAIQLSNTLPKARILRPYICIHTCIIYKACVSTKNNCALFLGIKKQVYHKKCLITSYPTTGKTMDRFTKKGT